MATQVRPRRSALYLPGSNARAIEKARTLPCDAVILDLEDSVAPEAKVAARALACEAVRMGGFGPRELIVRVNGLDTPWGADDLAAAAEAGPDAVLVPKVASPEGLAAYRQAVGPGVTLWAMIETCQAVFALDALGRASADGGVAAWVVGTNDLVKEMRCALGPDRAPLLPALAMSVMAARAHGLAILDGVYNDIPDLEGLARECAQAASFGFDGKSLIHPTHLDAANRIFAPDSDAIAWARTVAAAFDLTENAGKGVLKVEGRMVERLHLEEARRLIAVAEAISTHEVGNEV
ncbi:MAG TPA: CoA ester lyase [Phenylobacterium sp.]|jgi:citrate lyase subunit beta/citryl-CoA lyase|uniref:HpcH/HpaI aldolase/citrate lyase family protein n=1 Tax=Phenylobacterium sp. TaxID=1871053 RepID=UPI002D6A23BD|nr:CoA ester lyase [Phenylobacterium sp.]HZZ70569.1 CoA ester lyase [Phenylobacterium sp.]